MLISHDWLRAFVDHPLSPEQVRDLLSAHAATVDSMERLRADLAGIVVGRVLEAVRHPNADSLWLTRVDDGSGTPLSVVCGAPVVTPGTLYPFARVGTVLPGGVKIERRKIRGEISNGMLCSARELRLGEDHQGILALDVDAPPGTGLLDAVPVGDVCFDVDVLPNRPDLLSHVGMAREIAALTGLELAEPDELSNLASVGDAVAGAREASSGGATVRLDDSDGCPRYMGVVIRGVSVGPSPEWLASRLGSVGLRPISNVVDVTNYFLRGYGQPMHAFDLARLRDSMVVIRRASRGEKLVTLDGSERSLDDRMTVIADASHAIAVAGVMGGRDSEVGPATTDILLEVAYFTPRNVRVTRRALGLSTDASYIFERGIDPAVAPRALALAAGLIVKLAGGRIDGAPMDVGSAPSYGGDVMLRPGRLERLLGDRVSPDEIARLLRLVGFTVTPADGNLRVIAPSWRNDVSGESDLVEEVARLRGYDVLPDEVMPFRPGTVPDHPLDRTGRRVRDALVGDGLAEARPMPFVRGSDGTHVRVRNPLAEDEPHLRRSLLETLARRVEYNLSRMQGNVRLFEIGSAFEPRGDVLPHEEVRAAAVILGERHPRHFSEEQPPVFDEWDAKALGERIARLAYPGDEVSLEAGDPAAGQRAEGRTLWTVRVGGESREVGRVVALALDRPPWAAAPFGVEVTLSVMPNAFVAPPGEHTHAAPPSGGATVTPGTGRLVLAGFAPTVTVSPASVRYRSLPVTPAAPIDLALLLPDGVFAAEVERVIRSSGGELLESVVLFDEYRGDNLPPGHRSVAWRLTFRDPSRTLREKEIDGRRQKILRSLESELGVRPRSV